MKRNIKIFSLLGVMATGIFTSHAKTDVSTGDWEEEGPEISVTFLNVPTADFVNLALEISSDDKEAAIMWTTEPDPVAGEGEWHLYSDPICLLEDCTVSFYATLGAGVNSGIGTFDFVYSDYQAAPPRFLMNGEETYVEILCDDPSAEIRYTLDGQDPVSTSLLYGGPIYFSVGENCIMARVYPVGSFPSDAVTFNHFSQFQTGLDDMKVGKKVSFLCLDGQPGFMAEGKETIGVFTVLGIHVMTLHLENGFNPLPDLPKGVYVAGGKKICL